MIINRESLQSIYRSFRAIFNEAFTGVQPLYSKVAMEVPSSAALEEYGWLGHLPQMREWVGDRTVHNLAAHGFAIRNKAFELTVSVLRDDIEDDKVGIYRPRIEALGEAAARHPDALVYDLLGGGFTGVCFDAQPFFAPEHPTGSTAQSNRSNRILSADAYGDARAQMMSLTNEHGEPLGIIPTLLVVPPQLEAVGREILMAERLANGATNPWRGSADLLVVPRLARWPNYWFLLDTSRTVKPLIFQRRRNAEFVALDNPENENVFFRREYVYGVDYRGNAGYGLWQLAFGSTGEVA